MHLLPNSIKSAFRKSFDCGVRNTILISKFSTKHSDVSNEEWVPGPEKPSTWWPPAPRDPSRKVTRLYPVRSRHRPHIVLIREGCVNRPFFTIQVKSNLAESKQQGVEQVGSWDPFPNHLGEQLIGLNLDRISYWLTKGAQPSVKVAELLGLAGFLPIHPRNYLTAHRTRIATQRRLSPGNESVEEDTAVDNVDEEAVEAAKQKRRPDAVWRKGNEPPWWWFHGVR